MSTEILIGKVQSVDTGNISVKVDREELLNSVQINQIVQIRSTKTGEKIIGLISKIMRKAVSEKIEGNDEPDTIVENVIRINLVGTLLKKAVQTLMYSKEHLIQFRVLMRIVFYCKVLNFQIL